MRVHVEVLDENDNAPEFAQPYEPKVCENTAPGKVSKTGAGVGKGGSTPWGGGTGLGLRENAGGHMGSVQRIGVQTLLVTL